MCNILIAPFSLHHEEIRSQLAIKPGSQFEVTMNELIDQVAKVAKPKVIYNISFVEARGTNSVTIGEVTFKSRVMRANLDQINRVFPFIATCGTEIDEIPGGPEDLLKQYWLNTIKLNLLESTLEHFRKTIQNLYQLSSLSAMNPGSGAASVWPIEEQKSLFSLFGGVETVRQKIGVQLKPSYLMVPEISVSGILFPSESKYSNCQLCQRADCPGRRAHFDAELWNSLQ